MSEPTKRECKAGPEVEAAIRAAIAKVGFPDTYNAEPLIQFMIDATNTAFIAGQLAAVDMVGERLGVTKV